LRGPVSGVSTAGIWNDARFGMFAPLRDGGFGVRTFGGAGVPGLDREGKPADGAGVPNFEFGTWIREPGLERGGKPGKLVLLERPGKPGRLPERLPRAATAGTPPGIRFGSPRNGCSASSASSQPLNRPSGVFDMSRLTTATSPSGTSGDSSRTGIG